jgi:hypothetical protein
MTPVKRLWRWFWANPLYAVACAAVIVWAVWDFGFGAPSF